MTTYFFVKTSGDPLEGFSWSEAEKKAREVKDEYKPYEDGSQWKFPIVRIDPSKLNGGFMVTISTKI